MNVRSGGAVTDYLDTWRTECESAGHTCAFDFDGWRVRVLTNSIPLKLALNRYYLHFVADSTGEGRTVFAWQGEVPDFPLYWSVNEPEPGKSRVKEHIAELDGGRLIKKVQTGVHLAYLGEGRICSGPLLDNTNQVVNFINNLYLDHLLAAEGQLFHAAGVCKGQIGLGLAGQSGKGKSTLALRLLEEGFDFVSNDRLVVKGKEALKMHGVPKYPRINPGTIVNQRSLLSLASESDLARYQSMDRNALWELEEKYDAFIEDCFYGCRFQLSADMKMFVLIDWDREAQGRFSLERVSPGDVPQLIPAVMKTPGVLVPRAGARIGKAKAEDYVELLSGTEVYMLSGGVDFPDATRVIKDKLLE